MDAERLAEIREDLWTNHSDAYSARELLVEVDRLRRRENRLRMLAEAWAEDPKTATCGDILRKKLR
jgi:hypothetical protein